MLCSNIYMKKQEAVQCILQKTNKYGGPLPVLKAHLRAEMAGWQKTS